MVAPMRGHARAFVQVALSLELRPRVRARRLVAFLVTAAHDVASDVLEDLPGPPYAERVVF